MAINPLISLQGRVPSLSPILAQFQQARSLAARDQRADDAAQRDADLQPFRRDAIQAETESRLLDLQQKREDAKRESVLLAARELKGFLDVGDDIGAAQFLQRRKEGLISQGIPTEETDEAQVLLDQNPDILRERVDEAVQIGRERGLFGGVASELDRQKIDLRERELEQRRELAFARPELAGLTEAEKLEAQKGRKADIASEVETAKTKAGLEAQANNLGKVERAKFLSKNRETFVSDFNEISDVESDIDRAIEIWETSPGAISGPVSSRIPSLRDRTQELESILSRLGVARLANFKGSTSEKELAVAFRGGASIEQNAKTGIRRLKAQKRKIAVTKDKLQSLRREADKIIGAEKASRAPVENDRGEGQIMIDANGNRARVFSDGTFEEL